MCILYVSVRRPTVVACVLSSVCVCVFVSSTLCMCPFYFMYVSVLLSVRVRHTLCMCQFCSLYVSVLISVRVRSALRTCPFCSPYVSVRLSVCFYLSNFSHQRRGGYWPGVIGLILIRGDACLQRLTGSPSEEIVLNFFADQVVTGSCPQGFSVGTYGVGKCYLVMRDSVPMAVAALRCQTDFNAILVQIRNILEDSYLRTLLS